MSVVVTNTGASPIYINGIIMPFALRDASGGLLPTDAGWGYHCQDCEAICQAQSIGEPCPTYAELSPGATVSVRWDRTVWEGGTSTCPCETWFGVPTCAVMTPVSQGQLEIELPYRTDLPGNASDYTNLPLADTHPHLEGDGIMIRSLCVDGFGLPTFDQIQSAPLPSVDAETVEVGVTPPSP